MEIYINTNVFSEEAKVGLKEQFLQLIQNLTQQIDISTLASITITKDFTKEIVDFQIKYNKKERGHTQTDTEQAMLKVMSYTNAGEFKQVIFIHEAVFCALTVEGQSQEAIHYVHHELGHVHDEWNKRKIYSDDLICGERFSLLEHHLNVQSDYIWSEYVANRISFTSAPTEKIISTLKYLSELVDRSKNDCESFILEYRQHGDINKLMEQIQQSTKMLFYFTALTCGYLHGFKEEDRQKLFNENINPIINKTFYKDSWHEINNALSELYSIYPKWNDIYQLKALGAGVLTCWNNIGIYPEMDGEQMYIGVPY